MSKKDDEKENAAVAGGASSPTDHEDKQEGSIGAPTPQGKADDPFAPERLKIRSNFASQIGVKKILTAISVRKPDRQWFVRVNPDPDYSIEVAVIELKEDREIYVVTPELCAELPTEVTPKVLYTAINRQGVAFLWPITLPGEDGKHNPWHAAALDAAERAKQHWIRCAANMGAGCYDIFQASGGLSEPEWPDLSFHEILKIAFRDRYIESMDHPVIQKLMGKV